jgi:O-acetyl-ADP-ribose deacetylase (regulator of RNase III)
MKTIKGDLLKLAKEGRFDVICHGCNCHTNFGAGVAAQIKKEFPKAFEEDKDSTMPPAKKLGRYSHCRVNNGDLIVVNAYTQFDYKGKEPVRYDAIRFAFKRIAKDFRGQRIGIPMIGAGLAGGDWEIIKRIIDNETKGVDITVVEYQP